MSLDLIVRENERLAEAKPKDVIITEILRIGKAYVESRKKMDRHQRQPFSRLYTIMQSGNTRISLEAQKQLMEEIKEEPAAYNFEFIVNALEYPSILAGKVPSIYENDERIEASQKLIGEYFGEKLASRVSGIISAARLDNISYN